jgi:predicted nucleic acid-binding protein
VPKPKVYLETSFIGYLTARLSGDLITAAPQKLTRVWWDEQRKNFELYISQVVVQEVGAGDAVAATERNQVLVGIESLDVPPEASALAAAIISRKLLPPKAAYDALHVAVAAISRMDYPFTWNCKHIANAAIREDLEAVIRKAGYEPAVLCTPEELMGDDNDG